FPELVGTAEVAEMLGVSRQRVNALTAHPDFPRPVAELAAGKVWRKGDLSRFAEERARRPGRPRKTVHETAEAAARSAGVTMKDSPSRSPAGRRGDGIGEVRQLDHLRWVITCRRCGQQRGAVGREEAVEAVKAEHVCSESAGAPWHLACPIEDLFRQGT